MDVQHVKVRYSTDKGNYEEIFQSDDSRNSCGKDVYFTVRNNILTIFTKHFFTVFIVEEQIRSRSTNSFCKCLKQRFIDLAALAYCSVDYGERKVFLHVYVHDVQHKKYKEIKKDTDTKEVNYKNSCCLEETKLTGLQDVLLDARQNFSVFYSWPFELEKMLSTEIFDLENISDDEAKFLMIDTTSALGKVSYN